MFAPLGYRPILSVRMMAGRVAGKILSGVFENELSSFSFPIEDAPEIARFQKVTVGIAEKQNATAIKLTNEFVFQAPHLFVASADGKIVELEKNVLFFKYPDDDLEAYNSRRHTNLFFAVDTNTWTINTNEWPESTKREVGDFSIEVATDFLESAAKHLAHFNGWAICVAESDFPKNEEDLRRLIEREDEPRPNLMNISKAILNALEGKDLTKSEVRDLFPHLSFRQFDHHWRLAAEISPEISRPGRKS